MTRSLLARFLLAPHPSELVAVESSKCDEAHIKDLKDEYRITCDPHHSNMRS
jgi:hypothetical protein